MTLHRRDVVRQLLADRGNTLVVAGLGASAWDVAAATAAGAAPGGRDDDRNFYLWGGMGGAAMVGLGLALAQPHRRVLVITGDGELLMGLGSLATVALQRPRNLAIVALDNGRYGETGMQPSHTAGPTRLVAVASGCGIAATYDVETDADLDGLVSTLAAQTDLLFARVGIAPEELPRVLPERDGEKLKTRFRAALG